MKTASNGKIDENMKYFRSGFFDLGGQNLYVSRTGFTNELGFEIYSDGFKTDHLALWDYLMECGKPHGMEFSAARAMTIRRIEGGIFGNLTDIDKTITPFEAGLKFAVNMDKGDFIGRDALLNKDKRPCIFGITCKTETPVSGSKVFEEDNPHNLMKEIMPDIIVKGGDWTVETVIGNELADVKIFSRIEGHSTSDIIEKIKNER